MITTTYIENLTDFILQFDLRIEIEAFTKLMKYKNDEERISHLLLTHNKFTGRTLSLKFNEKLERFVLIEY